jgi:hypothetical protein
MSISYLSTISSAWSIMYEHTCTGTLVSSIDSARVRNCVSSSVRARVLLPPRSPAARVDAAVVDRLCREAHSSDMHARAYLLSGTSATCPSTSHCDICANQCTSSPMYGSRAAALSICARATTCAHTRARHCQSLHAGVPLRARTHTQAAFATRQFLLLALVRRRRHRCRCVCSSGRQASAQYTIVCVCRR